MDLRKQELDLDRRQGIDWTRVIVNALVAVFCIAVWLAVVLGISAWFGVL